MALISGSSNNNCLPQFSAASATDLAVAPAAERLRLGIVAIPVREQTLAISMTPSVTQSMEYRVQSFMDMSNI